VRTEKTATDVSSAAYCRRCDYPLAGLPDLSLCPECGSAFDLHAPATFRRTPGGWRRVVRRWLARAVAGLLIAAALTAGGVAWIWSAWRAEQVTIAQLRAAGISYQSKPLGPGWCWRFYRGPLLEIAMRVDLIDVSYKLGPKLEELDLRPLRQLKTVFLREVDVTDMMVEKLAAATTLEVLVMDWAPIDDAALAKLSALKNLSFLDIKGSKVTDAGMVHLGTLTNMRRLDLEGTRITDVGLEHLHQMRQLELLSVARTGVTARGEERMKGAAPGVRIFRW
jgi:hypothetical protein